MPARLLCLTQFCGIKGIKILLKVTWQKDVLFNKISLLQGIAGECTSISSLEAMDE
jgi:hypothetical protein